LEHISLNLSQQTGCHNLVLVLHSPSRQILAEYFKSVHDHFLHNLSNSLSTNNSTIWWRMVWPIDSIIKHNTHE